MQTNHRHHHRQHDGHHRQHDGHHRYVIIAIIVPLKYDDANVRYANK